MLREKIAGCYNLFSDFEKKTKTNSTVKKAVKNSLAKNKAELSSLQEKEFAELMNDVFEKNSYWRHKILECGLDKKEVQNLTNLNKLPILTKDEIRGNIGLMLGSPNGKFYKGTTSGSTGVALEFYNDSQSLSWADACKWRGRIWFGADRNTSSLYLWGQPLHLSGLGKKLSNLKYFMRNVIFFNTFVEIDDAFLSDVCEELITKKPKYIYGYGSSIASLSRFLHKEKITIGYRPLFVQFTADHMSASERRLAETVFGCRVISDYGSSEAPGIAEECEKRNMHLSIDNYVVEILGKNDVEVPVGEVGEVTVTALHSVGFPLIRYRTGDLGRKFEGECECGRPFPLFKLEAGKAVDLISTSYVNNVSAHILDYINLKLMKEDLRGIAQFYLEQVSTNNFLLKIVKEVPFDNRSLDVFLHELRRYLGVGIHVDIVFVGEIPLSKSGKRRYFGKSSRFTHGSSGGHANEA